MKILAICFDGAILSALRARMSLFLISATGYHTTDEAKTKVTDAVGTPELPKPGLKHV